MSGFSSPAATAWRNSAMICATAPIFILSWSPEMMVAQRQTSVTFTLSTGASSSVPKVNSWCVAVSTQIWPRFFIHREAPAVRKASCCLTEISWLERKASLPISRTHQETDLLAVLPFSFDYGFSQLTTAFLKGAMVVMMDYLLPRDVIRAIDKHAITGLAGVPPLWNQLCKLDWPESARETLRYITNSGGAMPTATLASLRERLPKTRPYLMYGLTEAFRSTYLPPEEIDRRPTSMGKAIPNAEILVVREDGAACSPGEPGELVHRGALVSLGYWNDEERTKQRFRPAPGQPDGIVLREIAVWSGDTVKKDEAGFLYFIGRKDDMIKTSGYRISPTEIEEVVYASGHVSEVAALGISHPDLGQAIVLVAVPAPGADPSDDRVLSFCREQLPNFMVPSRIVWRDKLPRNPNGKIDRKSLTAGLDSMFEVGE